MTLSKSLRKSDSCCDPPQCGRLLGAAGSGCSLLSGTVSAQALPREDCEVGAFTVLLSEGANPGLRTETTCQAAKQFIDGRLALCATYRHTWFFQHLS